MENWDTSKVIYMEEMFSGIGMRADEFNIGDISGWNVANVRLIWFVCALLGFGAPLLFYVILCFVMPVENQKASYEERMNKRLGK